MINFHQNFESQAIPSTTKNLQDYPYLQKVYDDLVTIHGYEQSTAVDWLQANPNSSLPQDMISDLQGYLNTLKGDLKILEQAKNDGELTLNQYIAIRSCLEGGKMSPLEELTNICNGKITTNMDQQGALMSAGDGLTMAYHEINLIINQE